MAYLGFAVWTAVLMLTMVPGIETLNKLIIQSLGDSGGVWSSLVYILAIAAFFVGIVGLIIFSVGYVGQKPDPAGKRDRAGGLIGWAESLSEFSGKWVAYLILPLTLVVLYEVFMRKVLGAPTSWAHETMVYLYGAHFMLGMAYTLMYDRHVRIDIIVLQMPPRVQAWLRVLTFMGIFLPFIGVLSVAAIGYAVESWVRWEHSWSAWKPPLYPYKTIMPVSLLLLLLQGVACYLKDLKRLRGEEL